MHLQPSAGLSRPVGEAIVNMLFPQGEDGRIPIVAVTGTNGKTTATRFITHLLKGTGKQSHDLHRRDYIDDRRIDCDDCSASQSRPNGLAQSIGGNGRLETARGGSSAKGSASTGATWPW